MYIYVYIYACARCRANIAQIRQSRPDPGLGFQVKLFKSFPVRSVVPPSPLPPP